MDLASMRQARVCYHLRAMSLGRRKIGPSDHGAWVFNRMADVYDARPPYPAELVDAIAALAPTGGRIGDVGAGIGHLALPLAARGFEVVAVEPAQAMLERLQSEASARGLSVRTLHAAAEALPIESASLDVVVVADALHFLDAERAGLELGRVLAPGGALALVTCQLSDTPFMRALVTVMEEAAPRRPRDVTRALTQLAAVARVPLAPPVTLEDETPVDADTLERILRSISFIGPAMSAARFAAFRARIHALSDAPHWARTFTLHSGRRRA